MRETQKGQTRKRASEPTAPAQETRQPSKAEAKGARRTSTAKAAFSDMHDYLSA